MAKISGPGPNNVSDSLSRLLTCVYGRAIGGMERLIRKIHEITEMFRDNSSSKPKSRPALSSPSKAAPAKRLRPELKALISLGDDWITRPFTDLMEGQPSYPALTGVQNSLISAIREKRGLPEVLKSDLAPVLIGEAVQLTPQEFLAVRCTGTVRLELLEELLRVHGLSLGTKLDQDSALQVREVGGWIRPDEEKAS